ncbi:MAG: hypothetical protein JKY60_02430 [Kordiimonadaceae bacterium]|nr:hypothetical protein [Kordiimonadaceae bacterium]
MVDITNMIAAINCMKIMNERKLAFWKLAVVPPAFSICAGLSDDRYSAGYELAAIPTMTERPTIAGIIMGSDK